MALPGLRSCREDGYVTSRMLQSHYGWNLHPQEQWANQLQLEHVVLNGMVGCPQDLCALGEQLVVFFLSLWFGQLPLAPVAP